MPVDSARVLMILGLAFEENRPNLRNSRELDVIAELRDFFLAVDVHDTWINPEAARAGYGFALVQTPKAGLYDEGILCVAHDSYHDLGSDRIRAFGKRGHVLYYLKNVLPTEAADIRL